MRISSTYSVKLQTEQKSVLETTAVLYRRAVDYFISMILERWDSLFSDLESKSLVVRQVELLCWPTARRPVTELDFGRDIGPQFYKFPCYLRRAAISEAHGCVSSYQTRLAQWKKNPSGKEPGKPRAGRTFPAMYRENMFEQVDRYTVRIKVFIRNTWDWITVILKKTDIDYINRHCAHRKQCVPTLRRRGKNWFLDFSFEEEATLFTTDIYRQTIVSVDLGINNACVCSVMRPDGTVVGRKFLSLPAEKDCLERAVQRIKSAQRHGARKMPRLWARAKGINESIAVKTARFIVDTAMLYNADVIVMEKLQVRGRKHGSKKWRLHHWRAQYVQSMVEDKAHRNGMRTSRVCAWNTSKLAYDGTGPVTRDEKNWSMCTFTSGKRYHCDLSASYNIGARYFIREIFKSLPATVGQRIAAEVPECAHRSTSTWRTLIRMRAALRS